MSLDTKTPYIECDTERYFSNFTQILIAFWFIILKVFNDVFSAVPPKAIIHRCPTNVTEENSETFNCSATGNPSPEVAWIRSGEVVVEDGAYVISAIHRSQKGTYECMAWNGIGNNSTANCTVDVQCK